MELCQLESIASAFTVYTSTSYHGGYLQLDKGRSMSGAGELLKIFGAVGAPKLIVATERIDGT
jgi:hypothetical protein